ncbi:Chromosome condensation regulator-like protein [Dorcoceras hygrometricum]|uniref:Chromosome condensation regulator-like protein n=1 Tax=Dorcoceras hygrometricum TaxID=472368 RepID=A0A2Z7DDN9_9LAMI|nr:Chromosome condensation regulator-like protein [Dorcoceras hygrometricum]
MKSSIKQQFRYSMQCIMSCKCMSGIKNIVENRVAHRRTCTEATRQVARNSAAATEDWEQLNQHPPAAATEDWEQLNQHPPAAATEDWEQLNQHPPAAATEDWEQLNQHPPAALNRGYATPHRTTREELQQSNISWLTKEPLAQYAMQMQ